MHLKICLLRISILMNLRRNSRAHIFYQYTDVYKDDNIVCAQHNHIVDIESLAKQNPLNTQKKSTVDIVLLYIPEQLATNRAKCWHFEYFCNKSMTEMFKNMLITFSITLVMHSYRSFGIWLTRWI